MVQQSVADVQRESTRRMPPGSKSASNVLLEGLPTALKQVFAHSACPAKYRPLLAQHIAQCAGVVVQTMPELNVWPQNHRRHLHQHHRRHLRQHHRQQQCQIRRQRRTRQVRRRLRRHPLRRRTPAMAALTDATKRTVAFATRWGPARSSAAAKRGIGRARRIIRRARTCFAQC